MAEVHGKGEFYAACWAEDFECFYRFETREERRGFCDGWSSGAGHYGAGCAAAMQLPEDVAELRAEAAGDESWRRGSKDRLAALERHAAAAGIAHLVPP